MLSGSPTATERGAINRYDDNARCAVDSLPRIRARLEDLQGLLVPLAPFEEQTARSHPTMNASGTVNAACAIYAPPVAARGPASPRKKRMIERGAAGDKEERLPELQSPRSKVIGKSGKSPPIDPLSPHAPSDDEAAAPDSSRSLPRSQREMEEAMRRVAQLQKQLDKTSKLLAEKRLRARNRRLVDGMKHIKDAAKPSLEKSIFDFEGVEVAPDDEVSRVAALLRGSDRFLSALSAFGRAEHPNAGAGTKKPRRPPHPLPLNPRQGSSSCSRRWTTTRTAVWISTSL